MSIFLEAKERVDEIKISKSLKPHFTVLMDDMHNFFTKHNLMNIFDLQLFFDTYVFNYKAKDLGYFGDSKTRKLKIKHSNRFFKVPGKYYVGGYFEHLENKVVVNKPNKKGLKILNNSKISLEEHTLKTLAHEFVHFLTLYGHPIVKTKNNKHKWLVELDEYVDFLYSDNWLEAFTEKMALEIIGMDNSPAYEANKIALDFITEVFDIGYENFLKRDFTKLIPYMSETTFYETGDLLHDLFGMSYPNSETVVDNMQGIVDIMLDTYKHKVFLTRYDIKAEDFFNKQINIVNKIPFNTITKYKEKINEINEIYITSLLEKENLLPTPKRVSFITKKLNQAIENAQENKLIGKFSDEIETCATVKIKNNKITIYKKKNTNELWLFDHGCLDFYHELPTPKKLFDFNNESYYESNIFFFENGAVGIKDKNKPMLFYGENKEDVMPENYDEIEESKPAIISFKNGKLEILANNSVKVVDLNTSHHLQYKKFLPALKNLLNDYKKSNKDLINFKDYKKIYEYNSSELQKQKRNKEDKEIKEKGEEKQSKINKQRKLENKPNFVIVNKKL